MVNQDRPLPKHLAELLPHVEGRDYDAIWSEAWLQSAGVVLLKKRTDLATSRVTAYWRSMNAEPSNSVKEVCELFLGSQYNCKDFQWLQNRDERHATKSDALYFHCVCSVKDATEL